MNHASVQQTTRSVESYRPQARFDLEWIHYPTDHCWVAHDPLSGEFFRFNEYEYAAVQLMDGNRTLSDLLDGIIGKFGRVRIDIAWIQAFVQRLQACLLLQPTNLSLRWIEKQTSQQKTMRIWQAINSPLSIRIPLFNPRSFLEWFYVPARILFDRTLAIVFLLLGMLAAVLVLRWSITNGLPQWNPAQMTIDRWLLLLVCYGIVKSLHELGHMLACARFKVRSSEVGVMLLCLMPCFYCDTTDAWRLASRWQRSVISAAGIYVELLIAVIASMGWLFLNDGTLDFICLNVMLVCSVSTVFLNANPLLRFDGYYILSDLWGVPNLHDQSKAALHQLFSRFILLQPTPPIAVDANPILLALFAVFSWAYRIFITTAILWMVWTFLPPLGLQLVSVIVTASIGVGVIVSQKRGLLNAVASFRGMNRSSRIASSVMWGLLIIGSASLLCLPMPRYITARGHVDYEDKTPIYATYDARVHSVVDKYSRVKAGSLLVQLESPNAELELAKLEGEIKQAEIGLEQLKLRRTIDPETEYRIPQTEVELTRLRARHAVLSREFSQLQYYAPSDGYLIDSLSRPTADLAGLSESRFKASFLETENIGGWVNRSAFLGWFCSLRQPLVIAIVPEDWMHGITEGGKVWVRLDGNPFDAIQGSVMRIAPEKVTSLPPSLVGDQSLVSIPKWDGGFETESPHYAVTIALDGEIEPLYDSLATISIQLETFPVYRHVSDFIQRSMRPMAK